VLNATKTQGDTTLRVYSFCSKSGSGIVIVVINLSKDTTHHLAVEAGDYVHGDASTQQLYLLTAPSLDSKVSTVG